MFAGQLSEKPDPPLRTRRVEIPPYTFWEERSGAGSPVVLLHGLAGSRNWWKRNVAAIAAHHLVATIDLVGFGSKRKWFRRSSLPLAFESVAELLGRWIERSFDAPVHLVGHSMGGQIAIHLAAARPELVRSLTLVGSTGVPFTLEPRRHLTAAAHPPAGLVSFSRVLAWDLLRAGPLAVGVASARLLSDDARAAMQRISVPTLLIWGEADPLVPTAYAEQMQQQFSRADLVILPNAGHVTMWDQPEAFNRELLRFLMSVEQLETDRALVVPEAALGDDEPLSWKIRPPVAGLAYRRTSSRIPNVILVHGLGIGTRYFEPFAHALHSLGIESAAPDLPGFGASRALPVAPQADAETLVAWHSTLDLPPSVWIGHSTGCETVEEIRQIAPERVIAAIYLGPVWHRSRVPSLRLGRALVRDAVREPVTLLIEALVEYLRAGPRRIWRAAKYYVRSSARTVPKFSNADAAVAGLRDPLTDLSIVTMLGTFEQVPGAHAFHYSHPREAAEAVVRHIRRVLR